MNARASSRLPYRLLRTTYDSGIVHYTVSLFAATIATETLLRGDYFQGSTLAVLGGFNFIVAMEKFQVVLRKFLGLAPRPT